MSLPRLIIKLHQKKSRRGPGLRELPKILGSFNISATAEARNLKFGVQLKFAKAHHKIPPRRKRGRGPRLGELPKFGVFPVIFMQWLKVSTSNLVHRVGGQLGPS